MNREVHALDLRGRAGEIPARYPAVHSPVGCKVSPRMLMRRVAWSITASTQARVPSSRSAVKKAAPGPRRPGSAGTVTRPARSVAGGVDAAGPEDLPDGRRCDLNPQTRE